MADPTPFREGVITNSTQKQQWLDQCAKCFDKFVADAGVESEAVFMIIFGNGTI